MMPPQTEPMGDAKDTGKCKNTCDLLIFCEESDKHVRISWRDAMEACCLGEIPEGTTIKGKNGNMKVGLHNKTGTDHDIDFIFAAEEIAKFNEGDPGVKWTDLNTDIRIVLARPFIEHLMHSAILTVAGRDTGATLFGPADMQLSANTQVKTIEGHYTGHFKSVVTKPQNVYVMRDIACAGYVAGCNTQFFTRNPDADNYTLATGQSNMMRRLSFADDVGGSYQSMLAFPALGAQFESGHLDTVMSVTTRLLPWEVTSAGGGTNNSFPGGDAMFREYNNKLGLSSVQSAAAPALPRCLRAPRSLPLSRRRARSCCAQLRRGHEGRREHGVHLARLDQQCHLLPRPAPPLRPVHQGLLLARAGPGPVRSPRPTSLLPLRSAHASVCAVRAQLRPRRDPRRCAVASGGALARSSPLSL